MVARKGFSRFGSWGRAFLVLVVPLLLALTANAQWTVVNLHPAGATESKALGVSAGQQVGYAVVSGVYRACLWSGAAASRVDLHPAGATFSWCLGVGGGQQVGRADVGGGSRASMWSGSAASWVDLTPAGSYSPQAYGASGGQQVGFASVGSYYHASLWSGSAASWLDLNPLGAEYSEATGMGGGQQVGYVHLWGGQGSYWDRASLWSGTAASWVNLNPPGSAYSYAYGASGGQQVGWAYVGLGVRASLWAGSAASWVDLTPAGADYGEATGVCDGQQVGWASVGNYYHASLWRGTAASWTDLHAYLPAYFSTSQAKGIWRDTTTTYVVGYGYNTSTNRHEALMWVSKTPAFNQRPTVNIRNVSIQKDSASGHFSIKVETAHTLVRTAGAIVLNLTEPGLQGVGAVNQSYTFEVPRNSTRKVWTCDLEIRNVPRFVRPMNFTVIATVFEGSLSSLPATRSLQVKIPVLMIHGIISPYWGDGVDQNLVSQLQASGYVLSGQYPTLFSDVPNYDPNNETLGDDAAWVDDYIGAASGPVGQTYAAKVDIVAHSKGGVVARQYIKNHDPTGATIRRLIMACSPHTGATSAHALPNDPPYQQLLPTHPWWRETAFTNFGEPYDNAALKSLNSFPMPQGLKYYLLYGYGRNTSANFTVVPPWYNTNDGDGVLGSNAGVLAWSAQGYEVVNENTFSGNSVRGSLIRAFDESMGAQKWTGEPIGLDFDHMGFLGDAALVINQILFAP